MGTVPTGDTRGRGGGILRVTIHAHLGLFCHPGNLPKDGLRTVGRLHFRHRGGRVIIGGSSTCGLAFGRFSVGKRGVRQTKVILTGKGLGVGLPTNANGTRRIGCDVVGSFNITNRVLAGPVG